MACPTRNSEAPAAGFDRVRPSRRRVQGFTYVGLLITIAIMTSALALAAPVWEVAKRREKEAELLFVGGEFRRALIGYSKFGTSDANRYPKALEDLVKDPRFAGNRRFLRKVYRDPITGSLDWGLQRDQSGGIFAVYSKSELEPIKQANFKAADRELEGKTKYSEWLFTDKSRGPPPKTGVEKPAKGGVDFGPAPPSQSPALGAVPPS